MPTLVIVRHGQSEWNAKNLFTGWRDVELTEKGVGEAREGGRVLRDEALGFDVAYTSLQQRAIKTLWLVLEEMNRMWIPVIRDWRLNERHYGALQGLDKAETVRKHGAEQVQIWRRSYATPPPPVDANDRENNPRFDERYAGIPVEQLPLSECLADTVARVMPCWNERIAPDLKAGKTVLISAHGNSLRALAKHLEGISDEDIVSLNIPTGVPRLYELDDDLRPTDVRYLGDANEIEARVQGVVNQTKA